MTPNLLLFFGSISGLFICIMLLCCLFGINSRNNDVRVLPNNVVDSPRNIQYPEHGIIIIDTY